jgi:hypothetical protein
VRARKGRLVSMSESPAAGRSDTAGRLVPLEELPDARVPLLATVVVPPARKPRRDRALTARLGLS